MEAIGCFFSYFLVYLVFAVILRVVLYGVVLEFFDLEKIAIKIKPKKPIFKEPIYRLYKSNYGYYSIKKYEMVISIEYFKSALLVLLLYPVFCYQWQYDFIQKIDLDDSEDDVFKYTKEDFIQMFDKLEREEKLKLEKEIEYKNKTNSFNEEFNENYNKLNK